MRRHCFGTRTDGSKPLTGASWHRPIAENKRATARFSPCPSMPTLRYIVELPGPRSNGFSHASPGVSRGPGSSAMLFQNLTLTVALRLRHLNMSPCDACTSTGGTPEKSCLPPVPHTLARSAIPNILGVAHARHPTLQPLVRSVESPLPSGFSGACLSRAQTTHVLLSTAPTARHLPTSAARACERCARRGWCVCLSPTSGSLALLLEHKPKVPDL